MTERLSDLEERIDSIHQLSAVITAMRGIAAARLREADEQLAGIRSYAETIAEAIGQALTFLSAGGGPATASAEPGSHLVIALCSEQGFVGGFNSRVLEAVEQLAAQHKELACELFVVGDRGVMIAGERNLQVDWSIPMATGADEVTHLASQLADALYERLGKEKVMLATIVHAAPGEDNSEIVTKALIPFDYTRFPLATQANPPIVNLPPADLVEQLAEEYVFAEICEAAMLSCAAENEARMYTLLAAHGNIERKTEELTAKARHSRQEEVTAEVIELASGALGMV